jgi:hypothetical protein
VNWVLDADIRGFYDAMSHTWIIRFLEHRIADKRILHAGDLCGGRGVILVPTATIQSGSIASAVLTSLNTTSSHRWIATTCWSARGEADLGSGVETHALGAFNDAFLCRHFVERAAKFVPARPHQLCIVCARAAPDQALKRGTRRYPPPHLASA